MSYLRLALAALAFAYLATGPVPGISPSTSVCAEEKSDSSEGDHDNTDEHDAGTETDHAHGEEGDGDHDDHASSEELPPILSFDPGAAIVNLAIFLCVFFVLAKFVWPVILDGLKAREDKIASDLAEAQAANEKAQGILADYEKKVAEASSEAQSILAEARKDAEINAAKIVEEAKADAKRQADRALADIETAKKVALSDIAGQTSTLAIGVAKQVVGRELKADDHADLIRNALDQVPSNN